MHSTFPLQDQLSAVAVLNVKAAAANGSNHITLSWPRLTSVDSLTCLDDLY